MSTSNSNSSSAPQHKRARREHGGKRRGGGGGSGAQGHGHGRGVCFAYLGPDGCARPESECRFAHDVAAAFGAEEYAFLAEQARLREVAEPLGGEDDEWPLPPPFQVAFVSAGKREDAVEMLVHGSGTVAMCVGRAHPAVERGVSVSKVEFGEDVEPGKNLELGATLARVSLSSGETLAVKTPLPGRVIEVNARLANEPDLVRTSRDSRGFLVLLAADKAHHRGMHRFYRVSRGSVRDMGPDSEEP